MSATAKFGPASNMPSRAARDYKILRDYRRAARSRATTAAGIAHSTTSLSPAEPETGHGQRPHELRDITWQGSILRATTIAWLRVPVSLPQSSA